AQRLLRVPRHANLALRVAGFEEPEELRLTPFGEAFVSLREEPSRPVERVITMTSVAEDLPLNPAADIIQLRVGELDDVERVRDLDRVRERVVERLAIRPGQIQRRPPDVVPPRLWSAIDPCGGGLRGAALDDIEELRRPGDINDRG